MTMYRRPEHGELVGDVDSFEYHAIWTICNYSTLQNTKNPMEFVISPCFSLGNVEYKWQLRFYPKGCNAPGYVSVYLSNRSRVDIEASAKISLVTGSNELRNTQSLNITKYENIAYKNNGKGLSQFLTIRTLFERRAELLEDDELKIHVELSNVFVSNPKEADLKFQPEPPDMLGQSPS